jgi:multiple sugar transport system ATP-binding protein
MATIVLHGVTKRYTESSVAVDGVDLELADGEFLALVGPSGCGKSTLLRMIAGLEDVTEGRIEIGGRDVTRVQARDRDIAMVFQNYALYPHMTVRDNLGYALKVRRTPRSEIVRRVESVAEMLGLEQLLDRKPAALSGGQRQRVAMGRAIVRDPVAFLMDEPLSNLDAKLRVSMRAQLAQLHQRLGTTVVYVTHDQVEAMTLGQRVAVLNHGRLQQVDSPQRLYSRPDNLFVATFMGSPAMNVVRALVDDASVSFGGWTLPLDQALHPRTNGSVVLGIRPEAFATRRARPDLPGIAVIPEVVEELGAETHVVFTVDASRVDLGNLSGETSDESLLPDERAVFTARLEVGSGARVAERIELAVDPAALYFFDAVDGRNLRLQTSSTTLVSR